MMEIPRRGLEIEQDPAFERRSRWARRAGGAVMGLALLAAALGLFGSGLFSRASAGEEGGPLRLEYDRFPRARAPQTLRVLLGPGAARGGKARLWLSAGYLEGVRVRGIEPPPESVELDPDGQTFTFAVAELTAPAPVLFEIEPRRAGPLAGRAKLEGDEPLGFSQFVYP